MSQYRARDALLVPSLLSLARIPLAGLFALAYENAAAALAILALSGATDVVDGWYARRHGQVTPTGAVIDPVTDKIFVLTVIATLIAHDRLSLGAALLLGTRELGELPLVVWYAVSHRARSDRTEHPSANVPGKLATAMQFVTVAAALFRSSLLGGLVVGTAVAGVLAAVSYWVRALAPRRSAREGAGPS